MPSVAIVGRPNVGKSTLFNRILGRRQAIVHPTSGLTRDRLEAETQWQDGPRFHLIDTGGIEGPPEEKGLDQIEHGIRFQAAVAAETADVIVFLVDGRQGLTSADQAVADMLRKAAEKVILAVNKVDPPQEPEMVLAEFHALGFLSMIALSAEHGRGVGDLMDQAMEILNKNGTSFCEAEEENDEIRVAVVGRPNAGKSSLVNRLLQEERLIVSDIPGTTRDAIDALIEHEGHRYRLIDTAGIRRKSRVEGIEYYSVNRAFKAIERSEVAVLMIDAQDDFAEQDLKIAAMSDRFGAALLILLNKWDAVEKDDRTFDLRVKVIQDRISRYAHVPIISISAKTGLRMDRLLDEIRAAAERRRVSLSTSQLNRMIREIVAQTTMPSRHGKSLKVYYMTQKGTCPPAFLLFVNDRRLVDTSFLRFLENRIRERIDLLGVPIRIHVREST